ncbi:hypothetical protein [Streptomyces sp. NBC_00102]|uniref:hypothetical protein n=1 Tax=Streptomyces sp. NBC_00102 TaxID=2975652 RepID=UPI002253E73F|nr:hypothetical protein [Streptomyces sp. NBC_00102]MCX5401193.1 hypothetical protein [Streptomyces sp. NBC_00102]
MAQQETGTGRTSRTSGNPAGEGERAPRVHPDRVSKVPPLSAHGLARHLLTGAVGLCLLVLVTPSLLLDDSDRPGRPEAAAPTEDHAPSHPGPPGDTGAAPPPPSRPGPSPSTPPVSGPPGGTPPAPSAPEPVVEASPVRAADDRPAAEAPAESSDRSGARTATRRGTDGVVRGTSVLEPGQNWSTPLVVLAFQGDGNLVLYDRESRPLWASGTVGQGARTVFQADGNLVVYTRDMRTAWSSRTDGHEGAELVLGDDGNLLVRQGGTRLWATDTTARHP